MIDKREDDDAEVDLDPLARRMNDDVANAGSGGDADGDGDGDGEDEDVEKFGELDVKRFDSLNDDNEIDLALMNAGVDAGVVDVDGENVWFG